MKGRGYNMKMNITGTVIFSISSIRSNYALFVNVAIYHHNSLMGRFSSRRFSSTGKRLQFQLSTDISDTYHWLKSEGLIPSMTTNQLAMIQHEIENGYYMLGPLEEISFPFKDMDKYLYGILLNFPDVHLNFPDVHMHEDAKSPGHIVVVKSKYMKDSLVLMGLSATLNRLFYGTLPENSYRLYDRFPAVIKTLENMKNIEKLYKVNMCPASDVINKSNVLKVVKPILGDSYVFRLVSSLFNLPLCINDVMIPFIGGSIPPIGEITRLLYSVVFTELFDPTFAKYYPTVRFTRFCEEIYVGTTPSTNFSFNEETFNTILKRSGISGSIESIESISRGGYALLIGGVQKVIHTPELFKVILLEFNGDIVVYEPEEIL